MPSKTSAHDRGMHHSRFTLNHVHSAASMKPLSPASKCSRRNRAASPLRLHHKPIWLDDNTFFGSSILALKPTTLNLNGTAKKMKYKMKYIKHISTSLPPLFIF
jgi:hypothetical protein